MVVGYLLSRGHIRTAGIQRLSAAHGQCEIVSDAEEDCRIRIGTTELRLPGAEQLEAFQPGTEYSVYYLAGPVPLVMSAERFSGGAETPDAAADDEERATAGDQVAVVRRGYVIVVLLGALALGIPVAGVMAGDLPPGPRPVAWVALLAVTIGFAWGAVAWLGRARRAALRRDGR